MEEREALSTLDEFREWCFMEIAIWERKMNESDPNSQIYSDAKLVLMGMSYTLTSINIFKKEKERSC